MKGIIKSYCSQAKAGTIECVDGHKYEFSFIDWIDEVPPSINQQVIFIPNGKRALEIAKAAQTSGPGELRFASA